MKILLLFASLSFAILPVHAEIEKQNLFTAGEEGYYIYRIPGLAVSKKGTVLAYCEARKSVGDWGTMDVMMRRSTDGGKTWLPRQKIVEVKGDLPMNPLAKGHDKPGDNTVHNPVAIPDRETGDIHFLYCLEYMRCYYIRSSDEGATWSEPVEITDAFESFRPAYDWKVIATGPAHGIQLTRGANKGRLVVPVWISTGTGGGSHRPSVTATIYSDDHGKTWQAGAVALPDEAPLKNPNETVVVELADGSVMLNARTESTANRRVTTTSPDGATGWTEPRFDEALLEPVCMAGILRARFPTEEEPGLIVFSNPHNLDISGKNPQPGDSRDRKNLSVKLSYDEALTWPHDRVLEPDFSGYSDLAALPDGTILCLYERGSTDGKDIYRSKYITFARFTEEWVKGD